MAKFFNRRWGHAFVLWRAGKAKVLLLRQNTLELGLVFLDGFHRLLKGPGDVLFLGQIQQVLVTRVVGQVEIAVLDGDVAQLSRGGHP